MTYQNNQIVAGINAGTFVILSARTVNGIEGYQVKEVNPNNYSQVARGEMFLEASAIKPIN